MFELLAFTLLHDYSPTGLVKCRLTVATPQVYWKTDWLASRCGYGDISWIYLVYISVLVHYRSSILYCIYLEDSFGYGQVMYYNSCKLMVYL
jgi:hypothetical protein